MSDEVLNEKLKLMVLTLEAQLGRIPTEDEVLNFINGDSVTRNKIWNQKWEGQK